MRLKLAGDILILVAVPLTEASLTGSVAHQEINKLAKGTVVPVCSVPVGTLQKNQILLNFSGNENHPRPLKEELPELVNCVVMYVAFKG